MGISHRPARLGRLLAALLVAAASLSALVPASPALAAAQPDVWVGYYNPSPSIGAHDWIYVAFDNTSLTDTGYGPYIDLFLPAAGADGAGAAEDDGITFASAAPTPLSPTPLFCSGGSFTHPLTRLATSCSDGEQVLVFELPLGSFAPDQPGQPLWIDTLLSPLADPGTTLAFRVSGGFWLGNDPLDNPAADPPIIVSAGPYPVTPSIPLGLSKSFDISKTVTGYSFPRQAYLSAALPRDQTFTNLSLSDLLPPTITYSGTNSFAPPAPTCSLTREPPLTGPQLAPNNQLTLGCPSLSGSDGMSFDFTYWVPRLDANGAPVLDPISGAPRELENNASVSGDWQPVDPRDAPTLISINPDGPEAAVIALSLDFGHSGVSTVNDIQASGTSPGDTLEYQLSFKISDYFSFGSIVISDTLSDGLRYLPGSASFSVTDRNSSRSGAFIDGADLRVDTSRIGNSGPGEDATDGATVLTFDLSRALRRLGDPDGVLQGADAQLPRGSTAEGMVTFRAVIQDTFSDTYPSGDPSVDMHDLLRSDATIEARVVHNQTLLPTGGVVTGGDGSGLILAGPNLTTTVYAVNGVACNPQPCAAPLIEPADTVTYRLTYTMPFVNVEDPQFRNFLPSPVFTATEVLTGSAILAAGLPPPGRVAYGPADTFHTLPAAPAPALAVDPVNNMVSFSYADYSLAPSPAGAIDLLFTVTASDRPFDDDLYITNQTNSQEDSTNSTGSSQQQSVEIGLAALVLRLHKGVVATNSPSGRFLPAEAGPLAFSPPGSAACPRFAGPIGSNALAARPINSNLRNLLVGEQLTFAIVIENYGSAPDGAFDVALRDELPPGLVRSGAPICVTDGSGAPLGFSELSGGLFGQGIRLNDPGATAAPAGALDPYSPEGGRNLAIITYDVTVAASVAPPQTLTNRAALFSYAKSEGGDDDGRDKADIADVTVLDPTAITLLRFTAARAGRQVLVQWATGSELNTRGFIVLRSDDGTRAAAVAVSDRIGAKGVDGGGAAYEWVDPAPPPGASYAYWLVELEGGDRTNEYGPARPSSGLQNDFRLLLPAVMR